MTVAYKGDRRSKAEKGGSLYDLELGFGCYWPWHLTFRPVTISSGSRPSLFFRAGLWRSRMPRLAVVVSMVLFPVGYAVADPTPSVKQTIDRGLAFLAKDNVAWKKTKQCAECHHAPFTIWALREGKKHGYAVDEKELADLTAWAVGKNTPADDGTKQPKKE